MYVAGIMTMMNRKVPVSESRFGKTLFLLSRSILGTWNSYVQEGWLVEVNLKENSLVEVNSSVKEICDQIGPNCELMCTYLLVKENNNYLLIWSRSKYYLNTKFCSKVACDNKCKNSGLLYQHLQCSDWPT